MLVQDEPNVKPNDEKMAQIQEPNFNNDDQQKGGGEAGVRGVDVGDIEEARAKDAEQVSLYTQHVFGFDFKVCHLYKL